VTVRTLPPAARAAVRTVGRLFTLGLVVYAVLALAGVTGDGYDPAVDGFLYVALFAACTVNLVLRAVLVPQERRVWVIFALGTGLYGLGMLLWAAAGRDGDTSLLTNAMWLSLYPLLYVGIVLLVRERVVRFPRSMWLDGLIGGLAVAAVAGTVLLGSVEVDTGADVVTVAINLAYPLFDLLLLAIVAAAYSLTGWRLDRTWITLGAGLALLAVIDGVWSYEASAGTYVPGGIIDAGWPLALSLIALAAWQRPVPVPVRLEGRAMMVMPALFSLCCLAVLVWDHFARAPTAAVILAAGTIVLALGRTASAFSTVQRIAETKRQALTDDLTGLANRRHFLDRLAVSLSSTDRGGRRVAMLLIDLDHFKELNDTLGHRAGDLLLRQLGPRLNARLGARQFLARLGGDEFAVLATGADARRARNIGERLREALAAPFEIDGIPVLIDASVGVAVYPDDAQTSSDLLRAADVAMYQAKQDRSGVASYEAERDVHSRDRLALMAQLRAGIADNQLVVHYQPKIDLTTGRAFGAEALVRWQHPLHGLLPPGRFVPLAEQTNLMGALTEKVLDEALRQCRRWREDGLELEVAVNVSPENLLDVRFPDLIARLLRRHRVAPSSLRLEVTEDGVIGDPKRVISVLGDLRARGLGLSIDDFGTGQSSLNQVRLLPVDELKIDRSFVMNLRDGTADAAIVESTIGLGHRLGLHVVAEGVERPDVLELLRRWGCDRAQGFLLGRPMPGDALATWSRSLVRTGGQLVDVGAGLADPADQRVQEEHRAGDGEADPRRDADERDGDADRHEERQDRVAGKVDLLADGGDSGLGMLVGHDQAM
jgi:diguanylate cyclase (GGDEF)-like protein